MGYANDIISLTKEISKLAISNGKLQLENNELKVKLQAKNEIILSQYFDGDEYAFFTIEPHSKEIIFKGAVDSLENARFIAGGSNTGCYKIYKLIESKGE